MRRLIGMDPLNKSLLQLFTYINFPFVPGETIEIEMVLDHLLELKLITKTQANKIHEVL